MARLSSELVLSLTDRVSGPASGVGHALDRLDRKQKGLARSTRLTAAGAAEMGRAVPMMLVGAATAAGAGLALGAKQSVVAAADFESALTGIQKKAGTTAEETAKIGEEIKGLATSGELAVPIEEIIGAYERGAAAGIPIAELKEFARLSVKAADAFEMPAEEVGNFAAKLKTSMGLSEDAIRRVFDLTNSLADAGIADEKDIVNFVDRTGASLKTLGLTVDETLAVGSTMLNLGMTSEVASTAMDALSSKMLTVNTLTGKGRKTFEKYMGPVGNFSKLIAKDANGALLKMLDTIQSLNGEQRMDFLSQFVGQDHAGKILRLSDAVAELRRNQALANDEAKWFGSLDAAYSLKLDDFWSQWQLVKNALEKLAIDTGTMGMPAFKSALDGALALVAEVDGGLKAFRAKVDTSEVGRAMTAVGELGGKIGEIMQLGGGDDTPLLNFFTRLADTANVVSSGINVARDVLESTGLVKPDADTSKDRQERRDGWVESYENFNPLLGPLIRRYRNWQGEDAPERNSSADEERARSQMDATAGTGLPTPKREGTPAAPAERGGRVVQPDAERFGGTATATEPAPSGNLAASMNALTAALRNRNADLGQSTGRPAVPSPRPPTLPAASTPSAGAGPAPDRIPIPTVRPNIAAEVNRQVDAATAKAESGGQKIAAALNVTVAPTVNTSSIAAAEAAAVRLEARLQRIAGQQARIREGAAGLASASAAAADFDGLHTDLED